MDRHDHHAVFRYILAALALGEPCRLPGDPKVCALRAAMFQNAGRGLPGDRSGDDHSEVADSGRGGDADDPARCVDECAAGKSIMHGGGGADHLIDGQTATGTQWTADDGDDSEARCDRVAPRSRDGNGQMSDPRLGLCDCRRRRCEAGYAKHGEGGRWIPARELRIDGRTLIGPNVQTVLASQRAHGCQHDFFGVDDPAGGAAVSLNLDHRRADHCHGVGDFIGEFGKSRFVHGR